MLNLVKNDRAQIKIKNLSHDIKTGTKKVGTKVKGTFSKLRYNMDFKVLSKLKKK